MELKKSLQKIEMFSLQNERLSVDSITFNNLVG